MKIGIVTRNKDSWSSTQLRHSMNKHQVPYGCFGFSSLSARIALGPRAQTGHTDLLEDLSGLIVRPIGHGSLEEIVFRMDVLYRLRRLGLYIVNPPEAIEHCVDKYDILAILEENGLPVPRTVVTENVAEALRALRDLGGDVIVKPIFGSRGVGATRINDPEVASTIFAAIRFYHGVIYLQEFVHHGLSDIRVFVIGNRVVAAMRRVGESWKTNYSQGASPVRIVLDKSLEDVAIKSSQLIDCKIAGVDVLESPTGPFIVEVNSQPGWKGLQSVADVNIADEIVEFVLAEMKK